MIKTPNYVTKSFLKAELKVALNDFRHGLLKELNEKSKKYRDDILTKLDEVVGELQTMREENTIGVHQTRELREEVDDHEKRITKLKSPTQ
ncbi:MAG: hypothetical protein AAB702_00330 [Patescibacteria group bacterium]